VAIRPPCDAGRACAHAHVRDALPKPHPLNGDDRECPECQGNLSINPADNSRAHILITCHGQAHCTESAAGRAHLRDLLIGKHDIDERCLGPFGLGGDGPTATLPRTPRREASPELLAAARRDGAYSQLIETSGGIRNPSILRMCLQAIAESDGDVSGEADQLIPADRAQFIALARRTGIPRQQANTLAERWFSRLAA
jgi:hypothetical protein